MTITADTQEVPAYLIIRVLLRFEAVRTCPTTSFADPRRIAKSKSPITRLPDDSDQISYTKLIDISVHYNSSGESIVPNVMIMDF